MRIDFRFSQRMAAIAQRKRQLMQPLKTCNPAIMLPKGHGQHPWHDYFYAAQTAGSVFWRSLIDHNDIDAALEVVADKMLQVVSQVHAFRWMTIAIAKRF